MMRVIQDQEGRDEEENGRACNRSRNSNSSKRFNASYKVAIVGDAGVGKTTLLKRFQMQQTKPSHYHEGTIYQVMHESTLGVDYLSVLMRLKMPTYNDNKQQEEEEEIIIRLELHDTAGSERFGSMIGSYLRDCDAILYSFSCAGDRGDGTGADDMSSLMRLVSHWQPFVARYAPAPAPAHLANGGGGGNRKALREEVIGEEDLPISMLVATQSDRFENDEAQADYRFQHAMLLQDAIAACCWPSPTGNSPGREPPDARTAVHWTSGRTGRGVADLFDTLSHRLWRRRHPPNAHTWRNTALDSSSASSSPSLSQSSLSSRCTSHKSTIRITNHGNGVNKEKRIGLGLDQDGRCCD